MFARSFLLAAVAVLGWAGTAHSSDSEAEVDAYWTLLHEPAVLRELKLTAAQRPKYQQLLDELDLQFFPLRNKSREDAMSGLSKVTAEAQQKLKTILQPKQSQRLTQILFWRFGPAALVRDDVATRLRLTDSQRERIQTALDDTRTAVAALEKEVTEGEPRGPIEKKYKELLNAQQKQVLNVLTSEQKTAWKDLVGSPFELSKLGSPAYKVPELVDTGEWINSLPLELKNQHGKVVVIHFYASGCINCIRNYPWYREWHDRFKDKEFTLIGIHTPETASEREIANVRKKAAEEKFAFPVLIDVQSQNWNAWGNSMWPSVYVIDKRGYLRHFWPGELKWKGNDGEKFLRERIEKLLEE